MVDVQSHGLCNVVGSVFGFCYPENLKANRVPRSENARSSSRQRCDATAGAFPVFLFGQKARVSQGMISAVAHIDLLADVKPQ